MIMKRILALLLVLLAAMPLAAAEVWDEPNWYEVFVRSYKDSDGDGIGDLNGLLSRLDYIRDMGWRGLWLMPVMPSPSYHKYDVTDYFDIDGEYGTLEDMRALTAACHEKGLRLIVDMPVNHTSTRHPWFQAAAEALASGEDSTMVGYYNFSRAGGSGYTPLDGTEWYYEERFSGGGMPDLNLDNPEVKDVIRRIFDFWLNDVGVDGFRLDAVTSYHTGESKRNIALLAELKAMAEQLKPDSFLVGECWANLDVIADYYTSGVDAFFLFPAAQAEGFVVSSLRARKEPARRFATAYEKTLEAIPEVALAPFLCNHDTGRTVGLVQGRSNPAVAKFAEGLLGMLNGRVFTYYGEEIGMVGSGDDPNKRLAMYWSDDDMTDQPPGTTAVEYAYPSVAAQQTDPGSLLSYVRAVNEARLDFPEISGGANAFILAEDSLCLMERTLSGESCRIAINFSGKEAGRLSVGSWAIARDLEVGESAAAVSESDGEAWLTLPPYGIVILKD